MRSKRALKSIYKTIKRYEEEVELISKTEELNLQSGLFEVLLTKKVNKLSVFKKKNYFFLDKDGKENSADVKIYSTVLLNTSETMVLKNGLKYEIVFVEEREESKPIVYIAYAQESEENE